MPPVGCTWSVRWREWCRITRRIGWPSSDPAADLGLYPDWKAYQQPRRWRRGTQAQRFDALVAERADFPSMDQVLQGMAANQAKLLRVLQRPEVPLHNNLSEGHIRDYVKKRKISGSTQGVTWVGVPRTPLRA